MLLATGLRPADLETPSLVTTLQLLTNPSAQLRELQQALASLAGANSQVTVQSADWAAFVLHFPCSVLLTREC